MSTRRVIIVAYLYSQFVFVEQMVVAVRVGVDVRAPLVLAVNRVKPRAHLVTHDRRDMRGEMRQGGAGQGVG